ncbi:MAG: SRPBCC family protein [Myxococcota bacterium]
MTSYSTSASVFIPRPRHEVFVIATDSTNAARTLRARGPFAGVTRVELHEGHKHEAGARRRVMMTDDSVLEEVILEYDPPRRHRYGWEDGAKFPFSLLVRSGTGDWSFSDEKGGTRVVWTYTFGLTSPLAYPLAIPIAWLFKGWLQQGLDAVRDECLA